MSAEEIVRAIQAFLEEATALSNPLDVEALDRALCLAREASRDRGLSLRALQRGDFAAAHSLEAASERLLLRALSIAQQIDDTLEPEPEI